MRKFAWVGALVLGIGWGLACPPRAEAIITRLTPLRDVLAESQFILTVKVDKLDAERLTAVLLADEDLKGKFASRKLPVSLKGDSDADKEKHTPQLLKRLAPNLPVILFVNQRGQRYTAFAYTNGTWFQMIGQKPDDSDTVRWGFTHCEPYLRRTFKGTTAEMKQVIIDGLSGKKKPPEVDPKEPPGFGPEVEKPKEESKKQPEGQANCDCSSHEGHHFAVIPTVLIGGPLAILAMLFPAVFGGLLLVMRRWVAVLTVASLNSTLILLHAWLFPSIRDYWWGTPMALWIFMTVLTFLGLLWAFQRHRTAVRSGQVVIGPRPTELIVLGVLTLLGVGVVLYCVLNHQSLMAPTQKTLLVIWIGVWAGMLYALYRRWQAGPQPATPVIDAPRRGMIFSTEGIMLSAMACASLGLLGATWPQKSGPIHVEVAWVYEVPSPEHGQIASTVLVDGDRVYAAGALGSGFPYGVLYSLDANSAALIKTFNETGVFDDNGGMKPVFSAPTIANGKIYIGEGFHQDNLCKLYCIDAATGKKLWHYQTKSHTESSPVVVEGKVFFGAGDDGVYCLDAETGTLIWHYEGPHVDTNPVIVGNRLYAGSGYGNYEIFCLDKEKGQPLWRVPVNLPAFATPAATEDGQVIFGIGNGNLLESAEKPAGALLCVEGESGKEIWRFDVGDGVHRKPAVDHAYVYCATRDQHCYCVRVKDGQLVWRKKLSSPVATAVALVHPMQKNEPAGLYIVTMGGEVYNLDPSNGDVQWTFDVMQHSQSQPLLLSSPVVQRFHVDKGYGRRIYFGAALIRSVESTPAVYCLEEKDTSFYSP